MSTNKKHTNNYKQTNNIMNQTMNNNIMKITSENENYLKKLKRSFEVAEETAKKESKRLIDIKKAIKLSLNVKFQQNVLEKYLEKWNISQNELLQICPRLSLFQNEENADDVIEGKVIEQINVDKNVGENGDENGGENGGENGDENEEDSNTLHKKFKKRVWNAFKNEINSSESESELDSDGLFMNQFQNEVLNEVERLSSLKEDNLEQKDETDNIEIKEKKEKKKKKEKNDKYTIKKIMTLEEARKWLSDEHSIVIPSKSFNVFTRKHKFNYDQLYYDELVQKKLNENNIILCDEEDIEKDLIFLAKKYEDMKRYHKDKNIQDTLRIPSSTIKSYSFKSGYGSPVYYSYHNTNDVYSSNNCCNNFNTAYLTTGSLGTTVYTKTNLA